MPQTAPVVFLALAGDEDKPEIRAEGLGHPVALRKVIDHSTPCVRGRAESAFTARRTFERPAGSF